ncbi:MAG TPA: NAD(P)H-binding protein [Rubrobacteraceae bacterium]|nr:NAD(P)H-binding protein [Rubrobacteraceae bacterium]
MVNDNPILITGVGGRFGNVGGAVVRLLRERALPVRALLHHDDDRGDALRALGAEVVVGDLTQPSDVAQALDGCRRMFFSMSISPDYLEAAVTVATVAYALDTLEALVAISQMTVSQMSPTSSDESHHQRLHFLAEQVLDWSGLPVVHIRPTVFLDNPLFTTLVAASVAESGTLRLPFGTGRSSPVAVADVARVVATVLEDPRPHLGHVYELTGPRCQDMTGVAEEFSRALGRPITYVDIPFETWVEGISHAGLPEYAEQHVVTVVRLHRENRYDRLTRTVELITGEPAQTVEEFVAERKDMYSR